MKNSKQFTRSICLFAFIFSAQYANSALFFNEDYTSDVGSWISFNGGELIHQGSGATGHILATSVMGSDNGAYTYGPGKTSIPYGFNSLRYGADIYIDPSQQTDGIAMQWSLSTILRNAAGNTALFEFDFYGKWVQDDGEGDANFADLDGDNDTTDWIYKIGRNNDWRTAPVLVEEPGWYTFTSEYLDNGTNAANNNYISKDDTILFNAQPAGGGNIASELDGYETGYMWFFSREGEASVGIDNLTYVHTPAATSVPEASSLVMVGLGGLILLSYRKR